MFRNIFVANRGAVARRVVRACAALGIDSVAAYSDVDGDAPHLGEATATARLTGYKAEDTYSNPEVVLQAALESGADALHPGYGFLAENAQFARAVEARGIRFIGPSPDWLEKMGEKTQAREVMRDRGFPVHAGTDVIADDATLVTAAEGIGYPLMMKPAGGGGGIGMTIVETDRDLLGAFRRAQTLAARTFGNGDVYLEKYLERARHIEFQMLGDGREVRALYERECSVQRRQQKLVEEAPAPGLDRAVAEAVARQAEIALSEMGYDNLGTVETLLCDGTFGFLEMNTRLQVEHGVTEEVTGIDLVAAQIRLAAGASVASVLPPEPRLNGFAVEVRVYAEDSEKMLPSTGRLQVFEPPEMTGVRVETGYRAGQHVTPYYDPLLAKVIGWGETREKAIGRTLIALKAFAVGGVATNIVLLQRVLSHDAFIAGRLHTRFLDDLI